MRRRSLLFAATLPVAAVTLFGAADPIRAAAFASAFPSRIGHGRSETGLRREPDGETTANPVPSAPSPSAGPSSTTAPRTDWIEVASRLDALVAAAARLGPVAVSIHGPRGERFAYDDARPMAMASLYKLLVLAAVHDAIVRRGTLRWDQWLSLRSADLVEGSRFLPDVPHTVDELADAMIASSDNGAAIALLRRVGGPDRANQIAHELRMKDTGMVDGQGIADRVDGYNYTTARDMATLLTRLHDGLFIDAAASAALLRRLERNQIRDRLPARLPPGARVAGKTGDLDGIRNDAGVIYTPSGPYVAVVLTYAFSDIAAANNLAADIGLTLWRYAAA